MKSRLLQLSMTLLLAFGAVTGAHAQSSKKASSTDTTVLPVWNNSSGKLEALLLLEPTGTSSAAARWRVGSTTLDAAFGLEGGNTLGLVCDRSSGLAGTIGNLANHCLLAAMDGERHEHLTAGTSIGNRNTRFGVAVGKSRDTLPAWLNPGSPGSQLNQNTLTVYGKQNIGSEATVSIGGTWARARLIPAGEAPALADRWNSRTLTVGAGYGDFDANIIGRVVDTPSQPGGWEGLGIGLTWRTPWSGSLTVGAEKITRGSNPFAPNADGDEGTVPYVRYEQDL